jgi:hypothetical protein
VWQGLVLVVVQIDYVKAWVDASVLSSHSFDLKKNVLVEGRNKELAMHLMLGHQIIDTLCCQSTVVPILELCTSRSFEFYVNEYFALE